MDALTGDSWVQFEGLNFVSAGSFFGTVHQKQALGNKVCSLLRGQFHGVPSIVSLSVTLISSDNIRIESLRKGCFLFVC